MKKLQLVAAAVAMCGLVGISYAADPPIAPLFPSTCVLNINAAVWVAPASYTFTINPNDDTSTITKQVTCVGGSCPAITFPCKGMNYFTIQAVQLPGATAPTTATQSGLPGAFCKPGQCPNGTWIYWSKCLGLIGEGATAIFKLGGSNSYGSNTNIWGNGSPTSAPTTCPTAPTTPTL